MKNTVLTLTTLATLVSTSLIGTVNTPAHAHNTVTPHTVSNTINGRISDAQFYSQVQTFIDAEDFNGLFQYSSSVIAADPSHAKAFYFRALSRFKLEQATALIIKDLDNAILADSRYVDALMARASMLDSINKRRLAIQDYGTVLAAQPDNMEALWARMEDHAILNDWHGLIKDTNYWISIDADEPQAFYTRAMAHVELGDIDSALEDLETTCELLIAQGRTQEADEIEVVMTRLIDTGSIG